MGYRGEDERRFDDRMGRDVGVSMWYGLEGIRHVDAMVALDGCLEKRWTVLHCIWQGVVAFSCGERAKHSNGAGMCFNIDSGILL